MAKVKFKFDRKRLEAQIVKEIDQVIDADPLKKEIGLFVTDRIRYQARIQQPLNSDSKFKDIKQRTIEKREYLEKYNKTHRTYEASRSNVTFTGQLLNSLGFNLVTRGVELIFKGERTPYNTGPNSRENNPPSNAEVDEFLREKGFFIFTKKGLEESDTLQKNIVRIIRKFLRRSLRK